jgi:hypothetical protein
MIPIKTSSLRLLTSQLTKALLFSLLLSGCDTFDSDVEGPTVKVSDDEVFVLASGETVIDLKSLVAANFSGRLSVTALPTQGTLKNINDGLLRYTPWKTNARKRDSFELSMFGSNNNIVNKDTVYVNIETDSTQLPCNIYPTADYVNGPVAGASITVDVLRNDILCGKSVTVQVYQPASGSLPHHGVAKVSGNKVVYTPGASFIGQDTVIYKVINTQNPSSFTYGLVYINRDSICDFALADDFYQTDTVRHAATYFFDVFANDLLCDSLADYSINVATSPTHGHVALSGRVFSYTFDDPGTASSDYFIYAVNKGSVQHTALVKLSFMNGSTPCVFQAVPDSVDISAISTSLIYINVLNNDQVCDSLKTLTITRQPKYGMAFIDSNNKRIGYNRINMRSDSLQYEICNGKYCSRATAYIKQQE